MINLERIDKSILTAFILFVMTGIAVAQIPPTVAPYPQECDCAMERVDDAFCRAANIFQGVPISRDTVYATTDIGKYDRNVIEHIATEFKVIRTVKGQSTDRITLYTADDTEPCGYNFLPGKIYLLFANEDDGRLSTSRCTPTREFDEVSTEFMDSLLFVAEGNSYVNGEPVAIPCVEKDQ